MAKITLGETYRVVLTDDVGEHETLFVRAIETEYRSPLGPIVWCWILNLDVSGPRWFYEKELVPITREQEILYG